MQIKAIIESLLSLYAKSAAKLCIDYNLNPEELRKHFDKAYTSAISTAKA